MIAPRTCSASFFFSCSADPRDLHSFPTRRSSDLPSIGDGAVDYLGRRPGRGVVELDLGRERRVRRMVVLELLGESPSFVGGADEQAALRRNQTSDRKSTRLNSSHVSISYAVFCLK